MMKDTVEERTYGRNKRSMGYVMGYIVKQKERLGKMLYLL